MSDDTLAARMLTCAAYLNLQEDATHVMRDAAELLVEGARALQVAPTSTLRGVEREPIPATAMPVILAGPEAQPERPGAVSFTDPDPSASRTPERRSSSQVCPQCGSRAAKKVRAGPDRILVAQCPACGAHWQLAFEAQWGAR
jgi:hypothetical protein